MKVELNISERITLLGILPVQGNFATLKVVQELRNLIALDQKELNAIGYKQVGDKATWDAKKEREKEFEFGKYELEVMREELEKLDKEKKMTVFQISLYEKLMKK